MELELFLNGKTRGPGPQHCGTAARSGPRCTESGADRRHSGASSVRGALVAAWPGSLSAAAGSEEGHEAEPVRVHQISNSEGSFIGAREGRGGGGEAVTVGFVALITIDGGAGLRRGFLGWGRVKERRRHL
jgi:hypothetical protein